MLETEDDGACKVGVRGELCLILVDRQLWRSAVVEEAAVLSVLNICAAWGVTGCCR